MVDSLCMMSTEIVPESLLFIYLLCLFISNLEFIIQVFKMFTFPTHFLDSRDRLFSVLPMPFYP
jgi:hypothetical protein